MKVTITGTGFPQNEPLGCGGVLSINTDSPARTKTFVFVVQVADGLPQLIVDIPLDGDAENRIPFIRYAETRKNEHLSPDQHMFITLCSKVIGACNEVAILTRQYGDEWRKQRVKIDMTKDKFGVQIRQDGQCKKATQLKTKKERDQTISLLSM